MPSEIQTLNFKIRLTEGKLIFCPRAPRTLTKLQKICTSGGAKFRIHQISDPPKASTGSGGKVFCWNRISDFSFRT